MDKLGLKELYIFDFASCEVLNGVKDIIDVVEEFNFVEAGNVNHDLGVFNSHFLGQKLFECLVSVQVDVPELDRTEILEHLFLQGRNLLDKFRKQSVLLFLKSFNDSVERLTVARIKGKYAE